MIDTLISIIGMVLVLSFLVIIHELGHFLAAKWMKIKVEEFGLGYPPRAVTLFKKWGTIFSLNWIPFGGFVRMDGEDGPEADAEPVAKLTQKKPAKTVVTEATEAPFYTKTILQRLVVILAGATVNFVFGILAFSIVFSVMGIPTGALITGISPGSPAEQVGLPLNYAIIKAEADGKVFDIRGYNQLLSFTQSHYGRPVTFTSIGPCEGHSCQATTRVDQVTLRDRAAAEQGGALGVRADDYTTFYPWYQMPFKGIVVGFEQAVLLSWSILVALGQMISNLLTQAIVPGDVMGPVGIADGARKAGIFSQGPILILLFAGVISVNLAIMNVLPIPALDGGRAVFILLEKIIGKKTIHKVEGYANYGGYIVLLSLIVLITARDVIRIVTG